MAGYIIRCNEHTIAFETMNCISRFIRSNFCQNEYVLPATKHLDAILNINCEEIILSACYS